MGCFFEPFPFAALRASAHSLEGKLHEGSVSKSIEILRGCPIGVNLTSRVTGATEFVIPSLRSRAGSERSEGSDSSGTEILRCAQDDNAGFAR